MNYISHYKNCYCHTCDKNFHYLGIARHRVAHKDKKQKCKITYTNGNTMLHDYSQ